MEKSINLYFLSKYFSNESTLEEVRVVENWVSICSRNEEILNQAKRIWQNDQMVKQLGNWLPFIFENMKQFN